MSASANDTPDDPVELLDIKFVKGKPASYHKGQAIGIAGDDLITIRDVVKEKKSDSLQFGAKPLADLTGILIDRKSNLGCGFASLAGTIICGVLIWALMATGFIVGLVVIGFIISLVSLYSAIFVRKWTVRFLFPDGELLWETGEDGRKHAAKVIQQLVRWARERGLGVSGLEEWLALNGR